LSITLDQEKTKMDSEENKTRCEWKRLQRQILRIVDAMPRVANMLPDDLQRSAKLILEGLQYEDKPWPLADFGRLARELDFSRSRLLAIATGNRYKDFLDPNNVPPDKIPEGGWKEGEVREERFIMEKMRAAGWNRPIRTLQDLAEVSELLGRDIDWVMALLDEENARELAKTALLVAGMSPVRE
jgi:hypothetical protein